MSRANPHQPELRGVGELERTGGAVERDERPASLETRRKIIHMLPGLIPFAMWHIYHEDPLPAWNLFLVLSVVATLTLIGMLMPQGVRTHRGENWQRTCLMYAAIPLAVLMLFPGNAEFAAVTLVVLAFGDPAAAWGGRLLGRGRLPWNPDKTWMGLACFIAVAAPLASLAYWGEARPRVPVATAILCGALAATAGGLVETFRSRLDDNLRISAAAAVSVALATWLIPVFA